MAAPARILPVPAPGSAIGLDRKAVHRFLVGYMTSREFVAHPKLHELLVAGINVFPGPFPVRARELEAHLDAVVRVKLPFGASVHALNA